MSSIIPDNLWLPSAMIADLRRIIKCKSSSIASELEENILSFSMFTFV